MASVMRWTSVTSQTGLLNGIQPSSRGESVFAMASVGLRKMDCSMERGMLDRDGESSGPGVVGLHGHLTLPEYRADMYDARIEGTISADELIVGQGVVVERGA